MKTKIPKENWFKVGEERLAHLLASSRSCYTILGQLYTRFYCGKETFTGLLKHDKNCFNRCWRCIEAYDHNK